jgi:hypothetical protein
VQYSDWRFLKKKGKNTEEAFSSALPTAVAWFSSALPGEALANLNLL